MGPHAGGFPSGTEEAGPWPSVVGGVGEGFQQPDQPGVGGGRGAGYGQKRDDRPCGLGGDAAPASGQADRAEAGRRDNPAGGSSTPGEEAVVDQLSHTLRGDAERVGGFGGAQPVAVRHRGLVWTDNYPMAKFSEACADHTTVRGRSRNSIPCPAYYRGAGTEVTALTADAVSFSGRISLTRAQPGPGCHVPVYTHRVSTTREEERGTRFPCHPKTAIPSRKT